MGDNIYWKNNKTLERQKILMENKQALSLEAVFVTIDRVAIVMMIIKIIILIVTTIFPNVVRRKSTNVWEERVASIYRVEE
jgi:hypothetical protein